MVPPPTVLRLRIEKVIDQFKNTAYTHAIHGPALSKATLLQAKNLLKDHVDKGCLSDPPGLSLYVERGKDKDGLKLYKCLRGTNTVELWHQFIEMRFSSWNAGPEFALNALILLVDRRNKRASAKNRADFPNIGHYDHHLLDEIQIVYKDLFNLKRFNWWKPADATWSVLNEPFGMVPTLPIDQQEIVTDADIKDFTPTMKFIAKMTKTKVPYIGMYGKDEKLLFLKTVSNYVNNGGIDHDRMADDWNSG